VPGWAQKLGFYTQLADITYSDSMRAEGRITPRRLKVAQTLCRTFLSFYLPADIPPKA